jgi:hypothetical protein
MNIQVMKQWGWGEIGTVMPYAQTLLLLSREMLALQNEKSHGNTTGVCDVRHTARKLITDQIITTDAETRSRNGRCNYDVMCNRARYTKCATNSGGQPSFD